MPADNMITGYQYGDDYSYTGTYTFPDNLDQIATHLPPHTTLTAPPLGLPAGQEAAFDPALQGWVVRDEDVSWMDAASRAQWLAAKVPA